MLCPLPSLREMGTFVEPETQGSETARDPARLLLYLAVRGSSAVRRTIAKRSQKEFCLKKNEIK